MLFDIYPVGVYARFMKKKPMSVNTGDPKKIYHRISRIEGQLQGIRRMIDDKTQCLDIITQVMAVRSAVSMLGLELLKGDLLCKKEKNFEISEAYLKSLFNLN